MTVPRESYDSHLDRLLPLVAQGAKAHAFRLIGARKIQFKCSSNNTKDQQNHFFIQSY